MRGEDRERVGSADGPGMVAQALHEVVAPGGVARWEGIARPYSRVDVEELRAAFGVNETLARRGAQRLWELLSTEDYVAALPARSGEDAIRQVRSGLKAFYLDGVGGGAEADAPRAWSSGAGGLIGEVRDVGRALLEERGRQGPGSELEWLAPIVVNAGSGCCGREQGFERTKALIEAGAAGVHFDDRSGAGGAGAPGDAEQELLATLVGARLAADVLNVPTVLLARVTAGPGSGGLEEAIERALVRAPYTDLLWLDAGQSELEAARRFAEAVHEVYPGKLLACDCRPSVDWQRGLDAHTLFGFQRELGELGYRFQYVSLAGFPWLTMGRPGAGRRVHGWSVPVSATGRPHPY